MKTYGRVEVYLHYSWPRHYMKTSGKLPACVAFTPRETAHGAYRIGGPQSRYKEEKNLLPQLGIEPGLLLRPLRSLVAIPTELSWLHHWMNPPVIANKAATDKT
jgi:hypothetical protein